MLMDELYDKLAAAEPNYEVVILDDNDDEYNTVTVDVDEVTGKVRIGW